jgi:hypothetical protein
VCCRYQKKAREGGQVAGRNVTHDRGVDLGLRYYYSARAIVPSTLFLQVLLIYHKIKGLLWSECRNSSSLSHFPNSLSIIQF